MFKIALITGLAVGAATLIGSLLAFVVKKISHKFNDMLLAFAAGIMLGATFFSLVLPSLEGGGEYGIFVTAGGVLAGALLVTLLDRIVPHLHTFIGMEDDGEGTSHRLMLFVLAIAFHNLPEGMAVGVGFGGGNVGDALSIAIAIALQNIPEGMITIFPLLMAGLSKKRALLVGACTGLVEVLGVLIGFTSVTLVQSLLPFLLALAGGTMLYVISNDMIPETHSHGFAKQATFSVIAGFIAMMFIDHIF